MAEQSSELQPMPSPEKMPETVADRSRSSLGYATVAIMFFVAGYVVAWLMFSTTASSYVDTLKGAAQQGAVDGASTAIAHLPPNSIASGSSSTANASSAAGETVPRTLPIQTIDTNGAPYWGPSDAKVTLVEFGDFECPYCEEFFQYTYRQLQQRYGHLIRFVFRNFPLPLHPDAMPAALAAECANEQGQFWAYYETLYNNQQDLSTEALIQYADQIKLDTAKFSTCFNSSRYASVVSHDVQLAQSYHAAATPTFFLNGQYMVGAQTFDTLAPLINQELIATGEVQIF